MADYWAKIYIEIIDDPKMATMPDRLWRRTIELFLLAKKFNRNGHLPETKQLAWMLRMPTDELDLDLKQIALTGIIQPEPTGWFVVNFEKRQSASTSTERSRQLRKRTQANQYYNGDATDLQRNVAQRTENRLTETETETAPPISIYELWLDEITGLPADSNEFETIKAFEEMKPIKEDMQAGYQWLKGHSKPPKYRSQLIGPTRTAMSIRLKNNHTEASQIYTDVNNTPCDREGNPT
jgi:hypothetical protein